MSDMPERPERADRRERADPPSWKPVPDPTSLTTDALNREVTTLREILEGEVGAVSAALTTSIQDLRRYYDAILTERDTRYEERFAAQQLAVSAAFEASEKAVASAFEAREKALAAALGASEKAVSAAFESADRAITKAEISIEKRADATYVALGELQRLLAGLMPRSEAETRYSTHDTDITDMRDRIKSLEATKTGKIELLPWIVAALAVAGYIAQRGGV